MKVDILVVKDEKDRLDKYLSSKLEQTRSQIQKLFDKDLILVNKKQAKASQILKNGDIIEVTIPEPTKIDFTPKDLKLKIYYEDEYLAVIDKKAGIPVHFSKGHEELSLVNGLIHQFEGLSSLNGEYRVGIVHRLDKDTSGLLVIAKTNEMHYLLSEMFKNRSIKKEYIAICKGKFNKKEGTIQTNIGRSTKDRKKMAVVNTGKIAITSYEVLDENNLFSLVRVNIKTGRTHQIRVHMSYINHPIAGDDVYGNKKEFLRQMLHAYTLEFIHPITNKLIKVKSNIPDDFKKALIKTKLEFKESKV